LSAGFHMTDRLPPPQSLEARPRETMAQAAFASLRESIVMGAIPPGAPLRLEELARTLNMSISPVREAIRQLEILGLAEAAPYKGARVTYLSISELQIVHDTRVGLESLAVRNAAMRCDAHLEQELTTCIEALDEAHALGDRAGLVHGNTRYHLAIARGSGSPWLAGLISQTLEIWERYSAAVILLGRPDDTFLVEAEGHRAILRACAARDSEAAEAAIRDHLGVSKAIFEQGAPPTLALRPSLDA
jgi:DNA-binding GntR family transcriptional regulator